MQLVNLEENLKELNEPIVLPLKPLLKLKTFLVEMILTNPFLELNLKKLMQICLRKLLVQLDLFLLTLKLKQVMSLRSFLLEVLLRIPKVQKLLSDFFNGKELNRGINHDEAVAHGAAVQANVLSGSPDSATNIVLLDVTPLTLGVETIGVMNVVLPRNTLPAKKSKMYTTIEDNQESILFEVYEGERPLTKENHLLGSFELQGIRPAANGDPQIEVTFEVDINGILHVTAEDLESRKKESITITKDKDRLTPQEIERMVRESETASEEDRKIKNQIEARNDLEFFYLKVNGARQRNSAALNTLTQPQREELEAILSQVAEFLQLFPNPSASQRESQSLFKLLKKVSGPFLKAAGIPDEDSEQNESQSEANHEHDHSSEHEEL